MPEKEHPPKKKRQSAKPKQSNNRSEAIAQARAIRREAAVLAQHEKEQAADAFETPETPARADADEIVAQLRAEAEKRAEEPADDHAFAAEAESEAADAADADWQEETAADTKTVEERVLRELRRLTEKEPVLSNAEAAKQYREITHDARRDVRKMTKQSERAWQKEASAVRAKNSAERTAHAAAKWNVAVCLTMLFGIAVGMIVLERPTVSMEENRTLAKMPEFSVEDYLNGKFTNGVAEYYNDTVPMRSAFKNMAQNFRKYMGLSGGPVIHGGAPVLENAPADTTLPPETTSPLVTTTAKTGANVKVTTTEETSTVPAEPEEEEKEGELSNNILIVDKRGIMLFGGWEGLGDPYARYVNNYKQDLPDVNVYSMVVPTVCSFYTPDEFQYLISSEKANIDYINNHLVDVTPVDAYSALEKHTDEPIFMRTDHHWSGLGAFYAAEAFSAAARVPFARISEYEKHEKEGYVGTLYGYSNDITLKENPETFIWYTPKANYTTTFMDNYLNSPFQSSYFVNIDNLATVSWYLVYMVGDDHVVHIETDMHNGRTLCVMKDSYGNALVPWLTSSFEDIYIVDMRYLKVNAVQFMRDHGVTDLLFAMNTFSANGGNATKIEEVRVQ